MRRQPSSPKSRLIGVAAAVVILALSAYLFPEYFGGTSNGNGGRLGICVFDVGQGDAILLEFPNGEYALVDAGGESTKDELVSELRQKGVDELAFAVGTHSHEDHIGGLDEVLNAFDTGTVYMPEFAASTITYEEVLNAIEETDTEAVVPESGVYIYNKDGVTVRVLYNGDGASDANNSSLILRIGFGDDYAVLMGDAETQEERKLIEYGYDQTEIEAALLKAGHHGSETSSSDELLDLIRPQIAAISVGAGNIYGHPDGNTIDRIENAGAVIYRTDINGTIEFSTSGNGWDKK